MDNTGYRQAQKSMPKNSNWLVYVLISILFFIGVLILINARSQTANIKKQYEIVGGVMVAIALMVGVYYGIKLYRHPVAMDFVNSSRMQLKEGADEISKRSQALAASANNALQRIKNSAKAAKEAALVSPTQ